MTSRRSLSLGAQREASTAEREAPGEARQATRRDLERMCIASGPWLAKRRTPSALAKTPLCGRQASCPVPKAARYADEAPRAAGAARGASPARGSRRKKPSIDGEWRSRDEAGGV